MLDREQMSLFPPEQPADTAIPGFRYREDFIDPATEAALLSHIDENPWDTTWKRRVQQYGFRYGNKGRRESIGTIPGWLAGLCARLVKEGVFEEEPNQVIVNEYLPGQGIAPHVDYLPHYGGTVASLSLASPVVMDFRGPDGERLAKLLKPRSVFVLSGPARYDWKHGIAPRLTDKYEGSIITRRKRISCTFRNALGEE